MLIFQCAPFGSRAMSSGFFAALASASCNAPRQRAGPTGPYRESRIERGADPTGSYRESRIERAKFRGLIKALAVKARHERTHATGATHLKAPTDPAV